MSTSCGPLSLLSKKIYCVNISISDCAVSPGHERRGEVHIVTVHNHSDSHLPVATRCGSFSSPLQKYIMLQHYIMSNLTLYPFQILQFHPAGDREVTGIAACSTVMRALIFLGLPLKGFDPPFVTIKLPLQIACTLESRYLTCL